MLYQLYPVLIHLTFAVSAQKVKRIAKRASLVLLPSPPPLYHRARTLQEYQLNHPFPAPPTSPPFPPILRHIGSVEEESINFYVALGRHFCRFCFAVCSALSISLSLAPFLLRFFSFFSRKMQIEIHIAHTCRVEGVFV